MQTYIGPCDAVGGRTLAVFKVGTRQGDVYMSVGRTEFGNEERAVVEVRRDALVGLWRNEMPGSIRAPLRRSTHADAMRQKLELADEGFQFGAHDPVPLVEVRCRLRPHLAPRVVNGTAAINSTSRPYVSIVDGAARTLWLASQGAACFPVECSVAEAPLLARLAGMPQSPWLRVSEMLPQ
ncbi:plasmid fertility inhibition factor family protein [Paraburkholderia sp. J67]|uniref:plasmid fertility inhibition factor family protein n=1 Tax=Paraburkholderia sp. J67 TaxID=2805435 RepID=UPI002ABE8FE3|nr:hypothetical protein [Paraburkholderia sp. J67]